MLTIFACPKAFTDPHIALIQRNAIRSWIELGPNVQVILFGDESGIATTARELSCGFEPRVRRNEFGTPLLNDVFTKAEALARHDLLCYVNADIILMRDVIASLRTAKASAKQFLLGGRVWNLDVQKEIAFESGWQERLRIKARENGVLRGPRSCDYFVYSRGLWGDLPSFIVGRVGFDNALLFRARSLGARLLDATDDVVAIHQNHHYRAEVGGTSYFTNPEALLNIELAGGFGNLYGWEHATHRVRANIVRRCWPGTLLHYLSRWQTNFWFPLLHLTRPVRHRLGLRRMNAERSH